jgi:hypothetical protein
MKTMQEFLDMDGGLGFNIALYNRFSQIGDGYAEICGGWIEGIHQWATHNIDFVSDCRNGKWTGWTIHFENGTTRQVYIENWVMDSNPKDWKHAKNLFNKYLRVRAEVLT